MALLRPQMTLNLQLTLLPELLMKLSQQPMVPELADDVESTVDATSEAC